MAEDERIRVGDARPRQTMGLIESECWQLLGEVSLGRIVFTQHAMDHIAIKAREITGLRLVGWCS